MLVYMNITAKQKKKTYKERKSFLHVLVLGLETKILAYYLLI